MKLGAHEVALANCRRHQFAVSDMGETVFGIARTKVVGLYEIRMRPAFNSFEKWMSIA